ncbi:hypothetical protein BDV98DRAFT_570667 [Pterulicium gracile]|uniref:Uncharacterized protein n=1 Tax=Pterulicium gracile TaxID=1884261 RepID=A0A5C3QEX5_9AGAR|nr:hypothetical protein BDV98DRAFT_570667 [Pterula gracilis]
MQTENSSLKGKPYVMRRPNPPFRPLPRSGDPRKDIAKAVSLIQDSLEAAATGKSFRDRPLCFVALYSCWDFVLGEKEGLDFACQRHPSLPDASSSSPFCHHTLKYVNEFEDRLVTGCSCNKTDTLIAWLHQYKNAVREQEQAVRRYVRERIP